MDRRGWRRQGREKKGGGESAREITMCRRQLGGSDCWVEFDVGKTEE